MVISVGGLYFFFGTVTENFDNFSSLFGQQLDLPGACLVVSLYGYMIADSIWCIRNGYDDFLNIVHHAVSFLYAHTMLTHNNAGIEAVVGLFFCEFTNIFLNIMWLSDVVKKMQLFWQVSFVVSFFVIRWGLGAWYAWWLFSVSGPVMIRVLCVLFSGLNVVFG